MFAGWVRILSVMLVASMASSVAWSAEAVFEAGAATVDITPPKGLPMWGYGERHDAANEGVMDRLEANAIVVGVGEDRIALVGLDLGRSPTSKSMETIRKCVAESAGVETIFLIGSHTHNAPILEIDDLPTQKDSYVRQMEDGICEAISEAAKNLRPAKIGVAHRMVDMNRNRHWKQPNPPRDPELIVLRFDDLKGNIIATAVNFSAHPTMINPKILLYSADFPGAMKRMVESKLGGECAFLQGAAGDLSAMGGRGRGPKEFGADLGRVVVEMARGIRTEVPKKPSIASVTETFEYPREDLRLDMTQPILRAVYSRAFFKELVDKFVEEYGEGIKPVLTVAILNDSIGIVGGSGEFFSSHSVRLKERSDLDHTIFLGYCNGHHMYFPTIEAASQGGYGADPTVSPVPVGAGEEILNRALFHLYDLRNRFKWNPFGG